MRSLLPTLAVLFVTASPAARAASDQVRVERVSGEPVGAQRMTGIADGNVVLVADSGELKVPLADVIQIGFGIAADPPQAYGAKEVAVDLGSGESLLGEIKAGDERGLTLTTPLLGSVVLSLDHIANVRFLRRLAQMPEPPDLLAAETSDVLHLVGGDRLSGTIHSFSDKAVTVETSGGETIPVAYDRITALRVMSDAAHAPKGTLLVMVLRDGSQVIGSAPTARDGRLKMKSVSNFEVDAAV